MTKLMETVESFYALVCGGNSIRAAADAVGVSRTRATFFWRRSAPMGLQITMGRAGGLEGSPPPDVWEAPGAGPGPLRRRLTSEDRAVIAAGVRRGLSYAADR